MVTSERSAKAALISSADAAACDRDEERLQHTAEAHLCARHALFARLESAPLTVAAAGALLRNYDAHASALRRLLLKAATLMPEEAVGFILENVRNEYGNGRYENNHQNQLRDLAYQIGINQNQFLSFEIKTGVREFIKRATQLYFPVSSVNNTSLCKAAIAAGAITATELLAIREFRSLQKAFSCFGLENHIWFHHVSIEVEHFDESMELARYFLVKRNAIDAVEFGLNGILTANLDLYDGLLEATTL